MKIAICDDNANDLSLLKELISEIKAQYDTEISDEYFNSGEAFILSPKQQRGL